MGTCLTSNEISSALLNMKKITLSTNLRSFCYRLLTHSLSTNIQWLKWKKSDTDKCAFCNTETETIVHLFWECDIAKFIWNQVQNWFKNKTHQNLHLSCRKILLCKTSNKALHCKNTIVLTTLQYIYACKCLEEIPNFAILKSKILDIHNIEKYIATKNNKLKKHTSKWQCF